jgi:Asp-tRNA(Asn)/Glu-tRNA(Gln) amidotransferase A subunit family amidase
MGFDLYGMNPYNPNKAVKPKIDWNKPTTEEERKEHFEKLEKYENEVVGDYFRSNVWWWRPLAGYVIQYTGCISEEDAEKWSYNDGHEVDDETAQQIHNQLQVLIESGHTQKFQDDYEKERQKMEKHNDKVEKELKKFCESVEKKLGKTNLAPADFPKEDHDEWERIYHKRKSGGSYPFSVEHVKEFAEFCRYSGGFRIC